MSQKCSAAKIKEKSRMFRYGLSRDFFCKGQKLQTGGVKRPPPVVRGYSLARPDLKMALITKLSTHCFLLIYCFCMNQLLEISKISSINFMVLVFVNRYLHIWAFIKCNIDNYTLVVLRAT